MSLSDLHIHLNGSFSLEFLEETARRNGQEEEFRRLVELKEVYSLTTSTSAETGCYSSPEQIRLIWQQFGQIHKIIRTTHDIEEGTIDVVRTSAAQYLEIRTTPKPLGAASSRSDYIEAFQRGLRRVNAGEAGPGKEAYGLLSLDRTLHSAEDAAEFIEAVRQSGGLLRGIDVCGNPEAPRTLTGQALSQAVELALQADVAVALHAGESRSLEEQADAEAIVTSVERWAAAHSKDSVASSSEQSAVCFGRVRLGHCIYLPPDVQARIRALQIPVEVCPTCHRLINWHPLGDAHPVAAIYPSISDPVVVGTDDCTIFGANAQEETLRVFEIFSNPDQLTLEHVLERQVRYRFLSSSKQD